MRDRKRALLINPYVYDFAYHDLWSKPLGLLYIAGFLRELDWDVELIDTTSYSFARDDSQFPPREGDGSGYVRKEKVDQPSLLEEFDRNFYRYGIAIKDFEWYLERCSPDVILVTSQLTYWSIGVEKTIDIMNRFFPNTPILLGGLYPSLCTTYAKNNSRADYVLPGYFSKGMLNKIYKVADVQKERNFENISFKFEDYPAPAYELYGNIDSAVIMAGLGCPFKCQVCASSFLTEQVHRKPISKIKDELVEITEGKDIKNIAFYDDALLYKKDEYFIPLMKELNRELELTYHLPNALHVSEVNEQVANILYESNFREVRLGYEGVSNRGNFNKPIARTDLEKAVKNLREAGFSNKAIRVYILVGRPNQDFKTLADSMYFAHRLRLRIELAYYSPIPGTDVFERDMKKFGLDKTSNPFWHNCTFWEYRLEKSWSEDARELRDLLNHRLSDGKIVHRAEVEKSLS